MQIELIRPTREYVEPYLKFVDEMKALGEKVSASIVPSRLEAPDQFVKRLLTSDTAPGPDLVPETTYWAINENGEVVGRISLRHALDKNLEEFGGHIGYEVRPSARKKGVATEMLRLVLETGKAREIGRLLLTCAPDNIASNRTIQKNGGQLAKTAFVERVQRQTNYYWVQV